MHAFYVFRVIERHGMATAEHPTVDALPPLVGALPPLHTIWMLREKVACNIFQKPQI